MTSEKPLELWIKNHNGNGYKYWECGASTDPNCVTKYEDYKDAIRMIEHSAYAESIARAELAEARLEKAVEQRDAARVAFCALNYKIDAHEHAKRGIELYNIELYAITAETIKKGELILTMQAGCFNYNKLTCECETLSDEKLTDAEAAALKDFLNHMPNEHFGIKSQQPKKGSRE